MFENIAMAMMLVIFMPVTLLALALGTLFGMLQCVSLTTYKVASCLPGLDLRFSS